jgi:hypothetical protein
MSQHLVLLGDSILDNAPYVPGRPAVIDQVRTRLPPNWQATLIARDGSVIADVPRQLERLPGGASHLVLSVGGNDVLFEIGALQEPVGTVGEGLRLLAGLRGPFESDYLRMLHEVLKRGLPTAVCTIYNPCSPDESLQQESMTALCVFNDSILRAAHTFRVPVIELRALCTEVADYANDIEPSSAGGAKIAQAICDVVLDHDFATKHTVLFP